MSELCKFTLNDSTKRKNRLFASVKDATKCTQPRNVCKFTMGKFMPTCFCKALYQTISPSREDMQRLVQPTRKFSLESNASNPILNRQLYPNLILNRQLYFALCLKSCSTAETFWNDEITSFLQASLVRHDVRRHHFSIFVI